MTWTLFAALVVTAQPQPRELQCEADCILVLSATVAWAVDSSSTSSGYLDRVLFDTHPPEDARAAGIVLPTAEDLAEVARLAGVTAFDSRGDTLMLQCHELSSPSACSAIRGKTLVRVNRIVLATEDEARVQVMIGNLLTRYEGGELTSWIVGRSRDLILQREAGTWTVVRVLRPNVFGEPGRT